MLNSTFAAGAGGNRTTSGPALSAAASATGVSGGLASTAASTPRSGRPPASGGAASLILVLAGKHALPSRPRQMHTTPSRAFVMHFSQRADKLWGAPASITFVVGRVASCPSEALARGGRLGHH